MKNLILLVGCLFFSCFSLIAQKNTQNIPHPIVKETFKVKIKVQKNQAIKVLSFAPQKGRKIPAKVTSLGSLKQLKLHPGTIIEGSFQFSTFASEGGLGTTRIITGEGKGELTISNVIVTEVNPLISKLAGVGDLAIRLN